MFKRFIRRLVNRIGFDLTRVGTTWRNQPVSREELSRISDTDLRIARQVEPYTATSLARVSKLIQAVRYVVRHRIPGSLVECGVWRGGSMMATALTLLAENEIDRELYLFDTFEGMSPPTDKDRTAEGRTAESLLSGASKERGDGVWCYAGLEEVRRNLSSTSYPAARIHYVKGKVEDTIPHPDIGQVALLRLDTDWYESTLHELNHLYPLLSVGGVLIIDDYGDWQGARLAVDQYMQEHPEYPILLSAIDNTGRLAVKVPLQSTL